MRSETDGDYSGGLDDSTFAYSQMEQRGDDNAADNAPDELLLLLSRLQEARKNECDDINGGQESADDGDATDDEMTEEALHGRAILDSQRAYERACSQEVPLDAPGDDVVDETVSSTAWWEHDLSICESQCSIQELGAPRVTQSPVWITVP